jgi:glycosyltransferase involved in cell wall biosynthesis
MRRARLYKSVRTAPLERARELAPATIVFSERRYDFDLELAQGLNLVEGRGLRAAWYLLRHYPDTLEVNEPLMLESSLWTLGTLLSLRLGAIVRRRPSPRVVTYAIENRNPRESSPPLFRGRVKRALQDKAAYAVWRRVDRIAFGTEDARSLYLSRFERMRPESALIWALPSRADRVEGERPPVVIFVSALSARKGVDLLLKAWPVVHRSVPNARLNIIGKGPLLDLVRRAAIGDDTIEVFVDPPRSLIHALLSRARVLVLPSRRTSSWREQVGLPIVEGLSHGCMVVTTTETGLARWLEGHGHTVVGPDDVDALAGATIRALTQPVPVDEILRSLPDRDGRLAADDWLFR